MINWIKQNRFKTALLALLTALFIFLAATEQNKTESTTTYQSEITESVAQKKHSVKIFFSQYCPHCHKLDAFVKSDLLDKYPTVDFEMHDIGKTKERNLLKTMMSGAGLDPNRIGTPTMFIGEDYQIGFGSPETTGQEIIQKIDSNFFGETPVIAETCDKDEDKIDTFFGSISLKKSLPVLAVTLGLVDGFNPCAMWVLLYLISVIMTLNSKKKMWIVVGTFLVAEATLYHLFLNFWGEVAEYVLQTLSVGSLIIGTVALYWGITDMKQYFLKEDMSCKVGNIQSKNRTKNKIKSLVDAEITFMTIIGLIGLAFVINSMEFMCSAGIPATFSTALVKAGIDGVQRQLYYGLYNLFFMLDDLIVFALAIFAIDKYMTDKYMRICKLVGGAVLTVLGILMLFFPEYLR